MTLLEGFLHKIISEDNLKTIISEELGIANEVRNTSSDIAQKIMCSIKETPKQDINFDGVSLREGNFTSELYGKKVFINYHYYNFRDYEYYQKFLKKSNVDLSSQYSVSYRINVISITFYSISGNINVNDLADSIYHETSHLYQQIRMGHTYPDFKENIVVLNNINSEDEYKRMIAIVLYLSNPNEQDSFANGLYGFICCGEGVKPYGYKESEMYANIVKFKNCLDKLIKHPSETTIAMEQMHLNISFDKFINGSTKALDIMWRKMGRTIIKAHKDLMERGEINIHRYIK